MDGISPAHLERIDAVLLSHDQHGDNLDRAGRAFLETVPLVLTTLWPPPDLWGSTPIRTHMHRFAGYFR